MEVWGRPSSPLLVPHTPVLRRAAIPRGGSPGWGRQPWHSRLPTGEAAPAGMCLVFRESLLQGNPEPFPTSGHPQELGIGSVPERCQALTAVPLHPLLRTRWLGSSRRWG